MWFRKKKDEGKEQREQNERRSIETQEALEKGHLPRYVLNRLHEQKEGSLPWTSNLSVNDWLLLKQYGIQPVGQVMGSSYYHMAYSMSNYSGQWGSGHLQDMEYALRENRELALQRLVMEAQALGAQAVVDVRLYQNKQDYYSHAIEFVAIGTAVRIDSTVPVKEPVLCSVSAMELAKLMSSGMFPVGYVLGVSVYYQYTSVRDRNITRSWFVGNTEMTTYTEAVYRVRHQAVRDMKDQAKKVSAQGILARETELTVIPIEVERSENDEREDHILEFIASGTAVIEFSTKPLPMIQLGLSLSDHKGGIIDV
ncbi:heavy metal-binding domain-containing protein [Pullulanibacillus sp. KACC 23026]|uniref:heavy metal-binding domain-containing protein n=1 Tax=Pullulanibacillus sp. KACC 23026 TaxID=3028315 RepID=UPI0023B1FAD0|nr:heavy metal-binding domain-containing protein [Pullulanibacillus sp. KACC 23026]WEG11179.1 heavy metal-binding domain-containing protein [Pullulanibacillus sp. KACC 23026]